MADSIFNNMKRYPIVFIGSGISKRFLEGYPNWVQLLEKYWEKINQDKPFYSYLLTLKENFSDKFDAEELDHKVNTSAAEHIEDIYNGMFYKGEILIDGLSLEDVYKEGISPFKYSICKDFSKYKIRNDDIDSDELEEFKNFLQRARIIVTTNYDPFIEDILEGKGVKLNKYVGNRGLFDDTEGWSELYKIHGDVTDPQSIIITQKDYDFYDKNSILISAKILSTLISTQIVFLGYSLTDRNIRRLLMDFSSQIPLEDERQSAERIIVVEYEAGNQKLESVYSSEFGVSFVKIKTDNYKSIFHSIGAINEGLLPSEVLRYKSLIKDLIVQEGGKGNLENILVSPSDLDQLEKNLKLGKNLVVALGNDKFIYTHVTEESYVEDYINEGNAISSKVAIDYIISVSTAQRIPFIRYLQSDLSHLDASKKSKLNSRIKRHNNLDSIIAGIKLDKVTLGINFSSLSAVEAHKLTPLKEVKVIIKNIKVFAKDDIANYIKKKAVTMFVDEECAASLKSDIRKLFYAYDLMINGSPKEI